MALAAQKAESANIITRLSAHFTPQEPARWVNVANMLIQTILARVGPKLSQGVKIRRLGPPLDGVGLF